MIDAWQARRSLWPWGAWKTPRNFGKEHSLYLCHSPGQPKSPPPILQSQSLNPRWGEIASVLEGTAWDVKEEVVYALKMMGGVRMQAAVPGSGCGKGQK